jgi:putative ABC transport system permease protein
LAEALLLMLIGAGIGMAVSASVLPTVNASTGGRFPPLYVSARTWAVAAALAAGVALAIGLPPALRARRLKIVDALAGHR